MYKKLEAAARAMAAKKQQQEEARAKLAQAPSSSGFKNAVQDALQRRQEAEARVEALRQRPGRLQPSPTFCGVQRRNCSPNNKERSGSKC